MSASIKSFVLIDPNMYKRMMAAQAEFDPAAKTTTIDRALKQAEIISDTSRPAAERLLDYAVNRRELEAAKQSVLASAIRPVPSQAKQSAERSQLYSPPTTPTKATVPSAKPVLQQSRPTKRRRLDSYVGLQPMLMMVFY